jgi:outer membrane receptor protein involved in Fe transport
VLNDNTKLLAYVYATQQEFTRWFSRGSADEFDGDCEPLVAETADAPCEALDSVSHISPKIGSRVQLSDALQLRASYSEGFALAGGFAKFASGAQDLDVNTLEQVEIGALYAIMPQLKLDLSLYDIDSSNEINEVTPGEFVNFGQTTRQGVELSMQWQAAESLSLKAVYGYADSTIDENPNSALVGKQVRCVPEHSGTFIAT